MKRKGFTLIELLAVIVILAIIALIAVPVIMNIIAKSNKSAFKDSAYGIIKAGELYYSGSILEPNGIEEDKTFIFPNPTGLDIKGSMPSSGEMKVTKEGEIALAISNGRYCARKDLNETEVIVDENISDCEIVKIITSADACATKEGEICPIGTKVNVKVNARENYDFYVIKDTGSELTLIMDRNLGSRMTWNATSGDNSVGPLTALDLLEERTNGWTNIEEKSYTVSDDSGGNVYKPIERTNVRARMITKTEAMNLGCSESGKSCPSFLTGNTSS